MALLMDRELEPEDQDFEFPVCFVIEAESKAKALSWGNDVTLEHCLSNQSHELINTLVESPNNYSAHVLDELPRIKYGVVPSDEQVGW